MSSARRLRQGSNWNVEKVLVWFAASRELPLFRFMLTSQGRPPALEQVGLPSRAHWPIKLPPEILTSLGGQTDV